jgi:hypothetical protein
MDTVDRIATIGCTAERSDFDSQQEQDFSPIHVVQTGYGTHLSSYPTSDGGFLLGKSGRIVKLTTLLQLVPRSRIHGSIYPQPQIFS